MERIAVICDPHFHDIDYRQGAGRGDRLAVRTLADTAASTRVFNESFQALRHLLDDIVRRGIRLVVVAGDLTDDGQQSTMSTATALLADYSTRFGLRFFATPGNHDLYGIHGRHQSKRFLNRDGSNSLVTSDPAASFAGSVERIVSPEMYCGGYDSALTAMSALGFFRRPDDLHWESPFGTEDSLEARTLEIRSEDGGTVRRMIDASYLVEPIEGLWVLSIDANVFEPKNGDLDPVEETSYIDSTDAGWNSVVRCKPFLLDWVRGVAIRAAEQGKTLLALSHYPALNTLGQTLADERRFFGDTSFARRAATPATERAAGDTGMKVHFSGHLHVNDTVVWRDDDAFLVNVAVPSMVGFPPAYKLIAFADGRMEVETVLVGDVPGFDAAFALYDAEKALTGVDFGDITGATSHADFLSRHLAQMVRHRYLPKEWPQDLATLALGLDLGDLEALAGEAEPLDAGAAAARAGASSDPQLGDWRAIAFLELVVDWYRLRKGRELALDFIAPERIAAYRSLASQFAAGSWPEASVQARLACFLRIMMHYLSSHPSRDFSIDLATGAIEPADQRGRTERRHTGAA